MDVLPAIRDRRSLRAFDARAVPEELLATLFEAARWAPSSGNGQPWRFVLARRGGEAFGLLAGTLRPNNRWAERAPLLGLGAARLEHVHPAKPPKPNRLALLELGLAVGNLLVQASALGLIAHAMAGFDHEAAAEALGVPDGHHAAVVIAIGFPGDPAELEPEVRAKDERPRERLPLSEIVFEGAWGEGADLPGSQPDTRG